MGQHGKYRPLVIAAAALLPGCGPALAQDCRLALVLGLDVSSSVDASEDLLQRQGLAAALLAPEVGRAFLSSPGPVALAVYEWSGRNNQKLLLDWRLIDSRAALVGAAEALNASTRGHDDFPTAMGYALGYGAALLNHGPACLTHTLDLSGDGVNNEGFPPATAYRSFPFAGVQVNGLVVEANNGEAASEVIDFYRDEVLHGPGAFLEIADGFEDFERAMRRKLVRELGGMAIGAAERPAAERPG